jgi:hypothetical protein
MLSGGSYRRHDGQPTTNLIGTISSNSLKLQHSCLAFSLSLKHKLQLCLRREGDETEAPVLQPSSNLSTFVFYLTNPDKDKSKSRTSIDTRCPISP